MPSRELVAIKVAEEIALGKYGHQDEKAADQAIRTASAIMDEGVTVAPIQGISSVRIRSNGDLTKHLAVYFAGPIRSAGGTEMGLILVVADIVRDLLGIGKYKATQEEAKRFVEELRLYEREVARFQYKVSDQELQEAIMRLPVEVNGVETDPVDVASFRNLPRVETNRVRGGALRVVNDGLLGRSEKVLKIAEALNIQGWAWLRELRPPAAEAEEAREFMFMEDVVGGRPIFCFPGRSGGFRLRYGRCRNTGLAALGVHPATMHILGNFIATGTQLRIEKPGKAGIAAAVDTIEPPIVKLKDGSVVRVESLEEAKNLAKSVESILFLGDLLVAYGEFLENNRPLAGSGFVEEWWAQLTRSAIVLGDTSVKEVAEKSGITQERFYQMMDTPFTAKPGPSECIALSGILHVPLHPRYTCFWDNITIEELAVLRAWLLRGSREFEAGKVTKIALPHEAESKELLERACIPHTVKGNQIIIDSEAPVLDALLDLRKPSHELHGQSVLEQLQNLSGIRVMRKAPTYIGARMGRPEKADRREMRPLVHCLYPLGLAGGMRRNVTEAAGTTTIIMVELVRRRCQSCTNLTHSPLCEKCGAAATVEAVCPRCGRQVEQEVCPMCKIQPVAFDKRAIDVGEGLRQATKRLGLTTTPDVVKGVRGLTNESRTPEPLEKGILRAKHDLSLFKDGTIRFDATNAPLTHFTPSEVGTDVAKLRVLGYQTNAEGEPLTSSSQLCALQTQDIVIPEECAEYLVREAAFLDELLIRFYKLAPYYNVRTKADLAGHLVVGLSPHTSVGVVGRIVGFTKARVYFAHPFWHAAKRRDCDGDEDSTTLALDFLLNFSRAFVPSRIGGMMDAPLLLTLVLKPSEIARQALNMETVSCLPLRFFDEAARGSDPKLVTGLIEVAAHRLDDAQLLLPIGFTHQVSDLNAGNLESSYKKLPTMLEKVMHQLKLAETIRAVDAQDVAKRVLSTHFMRDLTGNLKAFSTQRMRCTKCNSKFRRIPLKGVCPRCGGRISLTVYRGTVEKYLHVARDLVKRYNLGTYNEQRLLLIEEEIKSLFQESQEEKKQQVLGDFA